MELILDQHFYSEILFAYGPRCVCVCTLRYITLCECVLYEMSLFGYLWSPIHQLGSGLSLSPVYPTVMIPCKGCSTNYPLT